MATVQTSNVKVNAVQKSTWGSGYDAEFEIVNDNDYDILQWSLTFDMPEGEEFTWFSEGDLSKEGVQVTMIPKDWNMHIPAKTTKLMGFGGAKTMPGNVKFQQALPLVGIDPSLAKRGAWGDKIVAPYVDVCAYPTPDIVTASKESGIRFFTFAFITADQQKKASWAGVIPLNTQHMLSQVRQIREAGGDVSVSFGGANGIELAQAVDSVNLLVDEYSRVIDMYSLNRIDFDIEGGAVDDAASVDRRNKAIDILKTKYPALKVTYCLPVLPTGLTLAGEKLARNARQNNADIEGWNGMSMDFGDSAAENPEGKMGQFIITSCENLRRQVLAAGFAAPKIGTIAMIGVNDVQSEVVRIPDARQVYEFFKNTPWMSYVGFWSINRDRPGKNSGANPFDSGIAQNPWDFSKTFLGEKVLDLAPPDVPSPVPKPPSEAAKTPTKTVRPNINAMWAKASAEFVEKVKAGRSPDEVIAELQTEFSGLGPENQKSLRKLVEPVPAPKPAPEPAPEPAP